MSSTRRDIDNLPEGVYHWHIDDDQATRLSNLLSIDFPSLGITGHFLDGPELTCHTCGKLSGLDDFVGNALKDKIHTRDFMVDVLKNQDARNNTPPHKLECCVCGTTFLENEPATTLGSVLESMRNWVFGGGSYERLPALRRWDGMWRDFGGGSYERQPALRRWDGMWRDFGGGSYERQPALRRWDGMWRSFGGGSY